MREILRERPGIILQARLDAQTPLHRNVKIADRSKQEYTLVIQCANSGFVKLRFTVRVRAATRPWEPALSAP
jgi:hypothetical protein